jgi:hypothetical protein
MRAFVAAAVLFSVLRGRANAETPATDYGAEREARGIVAARFALAEDARLAKLTDAPLQKIGILTYYPNQGGGYTFLQGKDIVFYALPYTPSTYKCEIEVTGLRPLKDGGAEMVAVPVSINVPTIGSSKIPFGGQTVYRTEMFGSGESGFRREDIRLAYSSRDTSDGKLHVWILPEENETRLKLKSVVPVLEKQ